MIKAILFDVDGTLLDSEEALYHQFNDCLKKHDINKTREEIMSYFGLTTKEWFEKLAPNASQDTIQKMSDWIALHYMEYVEKYAKPFPHAKQTLEELRKKGVKVCVVTNQKPVQLEASEKILGFKFDEKSDASNVKKPKPDAEGINKILEELKGGKQETLFVGDSITDVEAANNAGIEVFLLENKSNKNLETKKIKDLKELLRLV